MRPSDPLDDITLPRILCLHGGGTNATVLRMQARAFISSLKSHFRLVFADAPFLTTAHPAIIPVYEDYGPFRMWYRWRRDQRRCGGEKKVDVVSPEVRCGRRSSVVAVDDFGDDEMDDDAVIVGEMEYQLRSAMGADDAAGGTGEWVGLLGFSQGARVAGSILYDRQLNIECEAKERMKRGKDAFAWAKVSPVVNAAESQVEGFAGGKWQFAVLIAGQGPFLTLSELGEMSGMTEPPGILPDFGRKISPSYLPSTSPPTHSSSPSPSISTSTENNNMSKTSAHNAARLSLPCLHIHGAKDPMLASMRYWFETQFEKKREDEAGAGVGSTLIEWSGNHRLPFKSADMTPIMEAIVAICEA